MVETSFSETLYVDGLQVTKERLRAGILSGIAQDEDGWHPLIFALTTDKCDSELLEVLAACGAKVGERYDDHGFPISIAVGSRRADLVGTLCRLGASPNVREAHGMTPLHMAAGRGDVDTVRQLLAFGADRAATDEDGLTALDFARGLSCWNDNWNETIAALENSTV